LFNQKIESVKNAKIVAQRCFLYFIEMYHLATFLIAESGELSALKDFLSRQVYILQNDLEIKEQLLETLNFNVQTVNKSRDFIYSRCTSLENKVNELNVEMLSASQLKSSLEVSIRQAREELKTVSAENSKLSNENTLLSDELKHNKSKIMLTNTMASVLVHIDDLLQEI
jgi:chromosome segregation ATPase